MSQQSDKKGPTQPPRRVSSTPDRSTQNFDNAPFRVRLNDREIISDVDSARWSEMVDPKPIAPEALKKSISEAVSIDKLVFGYQESACSGNPLSQVDHPINDPWRRVCKLLIYYEIGGVEQVAQGSGFFISSRVVLTAGHCVFHGGWMKRIQVIPAWDGHNAPYDSQTSKWFASNEGWTINNDVRFDYGFIILPTATLGLSVGHFGYRILSDHDLDSTEMKCAGYPIMPASQGQWYSNGRVKSSARLIQYAYNTNEGQSGGAIWFEDGDGLHAVGIHTNGGCPNFGVRITNDVAANIISWVRKYAR